MDESLRWIPNKMPWDYSKRKVHEKSLNFNASGRLSIQSTEEFRFNSSESKISFLENQIKFFCLFDRKNSFSKMNKRKLKTVFYPISFHSLSRQLIFYSIYSYPQSNFWLNCSLSPTHLFPLSHRNTLYHIFPK